MQLTFMMVVFVVIIAWLVLRQPPDELVQRYRLTRVLQWLGLIFLVGFAVLWGWWGIAEMVSDPSGFIHLLPIVPIAVLLYLLQAGILFLAASRLACVWAWVFIGLNLIGATANAILLLRHSPATVAERARTQGMKEWDKWVGGAWAVTYFVVLLVVAGLDQRLGWTGPLPVFAVGFTLFSWAMITNAYFAATVRIQAERGHKVCTGGPYRDVWVRFACLVFRERTGDALFDQMRIALSRNAAPQNVNHTCAVSAAPVAAPSGGANSTLRRT